jgi:hypothetical protein
MLAVRFLFGAGEAAPGRTPRTFSRWFPPERGRVQGVFFAGAFLFGGLTPALVGLLGPHVGWRGVFACFGLTGFVWAVAWFRWFRDEPADHPQVGQESWRDHGGPRSTHGTTLTVTRCRRRRQRQRVGAVPRLLNSYGSYFVMTWRRPTWRNAAASPPALWPLPPAVLPVVWGCSAASPPAFWPAGTGSASGGWRSAWSATGGAAAMMVLSVGTDSPDCAILLAVATAVSMFSLGAHWRRLSTSAATMPASLAPA